jgi:branched-chain amino acid transport system permease protein
MPLLDAVLQGLLFGGLYALYALGMALMFGVMRIVNIAHGDFLVLLAFCAIVISGAFELHPYVAMIALAPVAAIAGYALQRLLLNRVVGTDPLPSLIATFGLSITVQNLLLEIFTADARSLPGDGLESASVALGPLNLGVLPLHIFVAALFLTVAVHLLLTYTAFGRSLRASAADSEAAAITGVNPRHVYACALAVAAVFQALRVTVSPADGPGQLIYAFEAVIIGGMGSLWGGFIGALALGVSQSLGARVDAGWGQLTGHLVFLVILAFRPQGLLARPVR